MEGIVGAMESTSLLSGVPGDRRLSASQAQGTTFPTARFGGLNAEAVTAFKHAVARELSQREEERIALEEEVSRLNQEVEQLRQAGNGHMRSAPSIEHQSVLVLARAQENADRLLADAQHQASQLVGSGRQQREAMLADGRAKASHMIREAIDEAGRQAAAIAAQAPVDAQRRLAYYQSVADAARSSLSAQLAALIAVVKQWEAETQQGTSAIPVPGRPPTGSQPAVPLA